MGTIASLLSQMAEANNIRPWDVATRSQNEADTGLLHLQELKRQQETAARTRQFLQEHPEMLLGQGGGAVLGSLQTAPGGPPGGVPMTQQTVQPGMPPGAPQMVPGGQDLSRFATVPPTGGGPIPPNVAQQLQPTVTPPPGMPTLATLGQPQGQMPASQNRLLELARTSPDAAMQVQQLMQGQQDLALKRDEQRLTMGTKVAEYIGRLAQSVTDQPSLDAARQELARVHPQAAAQLPQTYSKESMLPYIKKALSVKDSAMFQLETWKNTIEMQKAGLQGEPAAMVSELRTMGVNPLQATTEQRVQAQKNIQQRELAKEGEAQRLKFEQEQQLSSTLPLQDARKEDAGLFVSKGTGQTIPGTTPYGQVKTLQDEKDPEKGVIKLANLDEKKQLTTLKQLEPVLQQYADLVQYAYGTDPKTGKKGPMADYQRGPFQTIGAMWNQLSQDDPVFQAKRRALQGQLQSVVRGLGARGDLNAQELEAATQMLANMDASLGLGLSLSSGPMVGTGGVGVGVGGSIKPSISLPDTPETGINTANELIGTVNRRIGSILQHEGYAKTPYIRIRTDQEREAKPGEMPRATAPPKPGPEPVPTPGQPIFPRPQIVIPGEGPAPALPAAPAAQPTSPRAPAPAPATTRPQPPTATSTPAQDEAYQQWQQQQKPPAPAPGKQSQARPGTSGDRVAQLAGAPKVMNLADVALAVKQTGRSRAEVEKAARARGYVVYGSKLKLPEVTMVG